MISTLRPSSRTALLAVSQDTASASATRAIVRCCTTMACNAHRSAVRDSRARGSAAARVSCRHTREQFPQRKRRIVTSNVVGRHPNGSCARRRVTVSRGTPSPPHRRHHRSNSPASTRHASTARSGSNLRADRSPTRARAALLACAEATGHLTVRGREGVADPRWSETVLGVANNHTDGTPGALKRSPRCWSTVPSPASSPATRSPRTTGA